MSRNNGNFHLPKGQDDNSYQLPLFKPGHQGWKNPKPIKYASESFSPQSNTLKTKEIKKFFCISPQFIRSCPMGEVRPWKAYLIWHQGRDAWKVYEEKLTV